MEIFLGILIPFIGTTLGAACVLFMKKTLRKQVQRALAGFAAGVMVAASIWSLLIPAIEQSENTGALSFFPAVVGFWIGVLFLLTLDHLIPHLHVGSEQSEGPKSKLGRTTMMVLAVTLHNIPEGMAVGVMYAGLLAGNTKITAASALALSLGIAIQNFPEGAIISLPLRAEGESKGKAFLGGVLSGVVEPVGAVLTIIAAQLIIPALPYLLSFAAGAMLYVVVEELIPEMSQGEHSNIGTVFFAVGFSLNVYLEADEGQQEEKTGMWLGEYYIEQDDDGTAYVWMANKDNVLEKHPVTLGDYDEDLMEYEIKDGLSEDDYITVVQDGLTEGTPVIYNDYSSDGMSGFDSLDGSGEMMDDQGNLLGDYSDGDSADLGAYDENSVDGSDMGSYDEGSIDGSDMGSYDEGSIDGSDMGSYDEGSIDGSDMGSYDENSMDDSIDNTYDADQEDGTYIDGASNLLLNGGNSLGTVG